MENKFQYYQFKYKDMEIPSGTKLTFAGEYFYLDDGARDYSGVHSPCVFKYFEDGKFYIEINGRMAYCKRLQDKILRILVLNGRKVPNPAVKDDVNIATIALIAAMAVSTIFHGNFLLWVLELVVYFVYTNKLKYDESR